MKYLLSSTDRTTTSTSECDFTVKFDTPLPQGTYKLSYTFLPHGRYNINDTNNKIYFNDGSSIVGTIANGMYTNTTLPAAVKSAMDTASAASGSQTYTITISSTTHLMTIASTGNYALEFGSNTTNSASSTLGFADSDTSSTTTHTGTKLVNLNKDNFYSIVVNYNSGVEQSGLTTSNYTFVLPVNADPLSTITYNAESSFQQYLELPIQTRDFRVVLRDEAGNVVDNNGVNWFLLLEKSGESR